MVFYSYTSNNECSNLIWIVELVVTGLKREGMFAIVPCEVVRQEVRKEMLCLLKNDLFVDEAWWNHRL